MALPVFPAAAEFGSRPVPFHVSVDVIAGSVTVAGELDRETAHHVVDGLTALVGTDHRSWTIDMSQVVFCDAAGLRSLLTGHHLARRNGCALVLDRPGRCVHRLLGLVGLDRVITVRADSPAPGGTRPIPAAVPLRSARRVGFLPGTEPGELLQG